MIVQTRNALDRISTFAIAILQHIDPDVKSCQALILAPRREMAQNIQAAVVAIGDFVNIECFACIGGTSTRDISQALRDNPQVVVGTPGLVQDMIQRNVLRTDSIKMFVLDEADESLSRGFTEHIYDILELLPQSRQVALFSATIPQDVVELTTRFMRDPVRICVNKDNLAFAGLEDVKQFYIAVETEDRKLVMLLELCETAATITPVIVFCNTRRKLEWLAAKLTTHNPTISVMHGDMPAFQRAEIMKEFRSGSFRVLIATNLLARGIYFKQKAVIVNYEVPTDCEHYIHRSGYGGRFGVKGMAVNLVAANEMDKFRNIKQFYGIRMEDIPVDGSSALLCISKVLSSILMVFSENTFSSHLLHQISAS